MIGPLSRFPIRTNAAAALRSLLLGEDGTVSRRMTQAALVVYALLHLAGWRWPVQLWGVDQLHYYGTGVALAFAALAALTIAGGHSRALVRFDRRAFVLIRSLASRSGYPIVAKTGGLLACVGLAWLLRVRAHTLGDSDKWFQLLARAPRLDEVIAALGRGHLPTLPEIPLFESLDFLVHLGAYLVAHPLLGWSESDAYVWLSCLTGVLYIAALWRLAPLLTDGAAERVTLVLLGLSLGSAQLFAGYGESYTLVTATSAWYLVYALRGLRGGGLVLPTAALLLCLALHLMAVGLLPSWLYLIWVRSGRPLATSARSPRVMVPVVTLGVIAAVVLYGRIYPYALPLLPSAQSDSHSLFSASHLALMGNAILLLSPFGIVWGLSLHHRARRSPRVLLLFWATLGTAAVVFLTDASLGGRDWDLLSYPALFYTLWGVACLHFHPRRRNFLRWLRWTVVPLVSCHTLLWIGINADEGRALTRLENLLRNANLPPHYQSWTLGYYYLNLLHQHYDRAADHFARAIAAAPEDELRTPGSRPYSYRKFLAVALGLDGQFEACVEESRAIYAAQSKPLLDANDLTVHQLYGQSLLKLALAADDEGDSSAALAYWRESLTPLGLMAYQTRDPQTFWNLSAAHRRLGNHVQSIEDFRRSLGMSESPVRDMIALGDLYLQEGEKELAATAYAQLLEPDVKGVTSEGYLRAGIRLYKVGHLGTSCVTYEAALAVDSLNHMARMNLAWNRYLQNRFDEAIQQYQLVIAQRETSEAAFGLSLANLHAGYVDSAWATYSRAVKQFSADEGRRIMADENLRRLASRDIQAEAAAAILEAYWP